MRDPWQRLTSSHRQTAFLLLLVCGAASADDFRRRCEAEMHTSVTVNAKTPIYQVDNNLSLRELARLKAVKQQHVLGLTTLKSHSNIFAVPIALRDPRSGRECLGAAFDVTLQYSSIIVHIGKEFPVGSCAYREVLQHEMRHVQAYLDHLPKVENSVRAALKLRFPDRPIYGTIGQSARLLQEELDGYWTPFFNAEFAKVEAAHDLIDTPAEYERMGNACKGEVQRVLRALPDKAN